MSIDILIGVGVSLLFWTIRQGRDFPVDLDPVVVSTIIAMMASLVVSMIWLPLNKFKLSRLHGIVLLVLYGIFLLITLLIAFDVIKF